MIAQNSEVPQALVFAGCAHHALGGGLLGDMGSAGLWEAGLPRQCFWLRSPSLGSNAMLLAHDCQPCHTQRNPAQARQVSSPTRAEGSFLTQPHASRFSIGAPAEWRMTWSVPVLWGPHAALTLSPRLFSSFSK